ncbi:nucleotidyltransferase family protein [Actinoalloteichus caeruleus]|uniref:nucleotidyltransferase family protein n=1 Tax=Actinoalloteichus cyanogriseus TaxID=2893586 RepID=UPI00138B1312|nr:nucleotidyltransferase family protein [Actinoalloteichus caeruleus]
MSSGNSLVDALAWSAGGDVPRPTLDDVDTTAFAHALHAHRLDARFLHRVRVESVRVPPDLVSALTDRLAGIRAAMDRRAALATVLDEATAGRDRSRSMVPLKGFTLLALTGEERAVRHSGDLDVVVADPAGFVTSADRFGLVPKGPREILDEYARLVAPEHGMVEVHSYYPVPRWRTRTTPEDCDPRAHPGQWVHHETLGEHRILHGDLVDHLVEGTGMPGAPRVLRPEAAVVVQACHLYGDYIRAVLPVPLGTVRLDEIAAVADMCALPGFDVAVFAELVTRFGAEDVVSFVRALSVDLLGRDPVPPGCSLPAPSDRFFPVDLWWDGVEGFLVDPGWRPAELVVRTREHEEVLAAIGGSTVAVPCSSEPTRISVGAGTSTDLDRSVFRPGRTGPFDVVGELSADDGALSVVLSTPAAADGHMTALSLNFGDHRFEFFHTAATGELRFDDYSLTSPADTEPVGRSAERTGGRDVLRVRIPWRRLGGCPGPGRGMVLLAGIRRQRLGWAETDGAAILPLRLDVGPA